jgi:hypothetical protein
MGLRVDEVIADQMMTIMVMPMMNMKIVQNKKAREEETRIPEWVRNPSVKVVIIPRRWIISNHRRTFIVIVFVNYRRRYKFTACRRRTFGVLVRRNS